MVCTQRTLRLCEAARVSRQLRRAPAVTHSHTHPTGVMRRHITGVVKRHPALRIIR